MNNELQTLKKIIENLPKTQRKPESFFYCANLLRDFHGELPNSLFNRLLDICIKICLNLQEDRKLVYDLFQSVLSCLNALLVKENPSVHHKLWKLQKAVLPLLIAVFSQCSTNKNQDFKLSLLEYIKNMIQLGAFSHKEILLQQSFVKHGASGGPESDTSSALEVTPGSLEGSTSSRRIQSSQTTDLSLLSELKKDIIDSCYRELIKSSNNSLGKFAWIPDLPVNLSTLQETYVQTLADLLVDMETTQLDEIQEEVELRKRSKLDLSFRSFEVEIKEKPELWIPVFVYYLERNLKVLTFDQIAESIKTVISLFDESFEDKSDVLKVWILRLLSFIIDFWTEEAPWTELKAEWWDRIPSFISEFRDCGNEHVEDAMWRVVDKIIRRDFIKKRNLAERVTRELKKQSSGKLISTTSQIYAYQKLLQKNLISPEDRKKTLKCLLDPTTVFNPKLKHGAQQELLDLLLKSRNPKDEGCSSLPKRETFQDWNLSSRPCPRQLKELLFISKYKSAIADSATRSSVSHDVDVANLDTVIALIRSRLLWNMKDRSFVQLRLCSFLLKVDSSTADHNTKTLINYFSRDFIPIVFTLFQKEPVHKDSNIQQGILQSISFLASYASAHQYLKEYILSFIAIAKFFILKSFDSPAGTEPKLDEYGEVIEETEPVLSSATSFSLKFWISTLEAVLPWFKSEVSDALIEIKHKTNQPSAAGLSQGIVSELSILFIKIRALNKDFSFLEEYCIEHVDNPSLLASQYLERLIDCILTEGNKSTLDSIAEAGCWIRKWTSSEEIIESLIDTLEPLKEWLWREDLFSNFSLNLMRKVALFSVKLISLSNCLDLTLDESSYLLRSAANLMFSFDSILLFSSLFISICRKTSDFSVKTVLDKAFLSGGCTSLSGIRNKSLWIIGFALLGEISESQVLTLISQFSLKFKYIPSWSIELIKFVASLFKYPSSAEYFSFHKVDLVFEFFSPTNDLESFLSLHLLFGMERKDFLECSKAPLIVALYSKGQAAELDKLARKLGQSSRAQLLKKTPELMIWCPRTRRRFKPSFLDHLLLMFRRFQPDISNQGTPFKNTDLKAWFYAKDIKEVYADRFSSKIEDIDPLDLLELVTDFHFRLLEAKSVQHKLWILEGQQFFCEIFKEKLRIQFLFSQLLGSLYQQVRVPVVCEKVVRVLELILNGLSLTDKFSREDALRNENIIKMIMSLSICLVDLKKDPFMPEKELLGAVFCCWVDTDWLDSKVTKVDTDLIANFMVKLHELLDQEGQILCRLLGCLEGEDDEEEQVLETSLVKLLELFVSVIEKLDSRVCERFSFLLLNKIRCRIKNHEKNSELKDVTEKLGDLSKEKKDSNLIKLTVLLQEKCLQ